MRGSEPGHATLLVANSGGHLAELHALWRRFEPGLARVLWATSDNEQSRDLLQGETVHFVPQVRPKDRTGALANLPVARRLMLDQGIDQVISTGAGLAVPYFMVARSLRLPSHYIESAARIDAPSLSGKLVSRLRDVLLYSQHRWTDPRWAYAGSVFDAYQPGPPVESGRIDKVVVSFGTQTGFGFERAARRISAVLPEVCPSTADVMWQVGDAQVNDLGIAGRRTVPYAELEQAIGEADLVISHAGVGSSLLSFSKGKCPVIVPRRRKYHEHTDDHQIQLAAQLCDKGLAVHADADLLRADDLWAAATASTVLSTTSSIELQDARRRRRV
jgi:UDP-N-acetylglucosamine--N-acetylmuramyl-(pentapeptide) pyrophosphoryl-undecaprenol N-acetylglucosamine transferase